MMFDTSAFLVSLQLATAVSLALFFVMTPIAYWFVFSRSRWRPWVDATLTVPLTLPPTVVGFYLLICLAPIHWAFTFRALFLGAFILNLPIALQAFTNAVRGVPRTLLESSWCLGWSQAQTLIRVVVPLTWRGLLAGGLLCFAHSFGEFGVAMMVGGNLQGLTRTVSISIYDQVQNLDLNHAKQTAVIQVILSLLLLIGISALKYERPNSKRRS